MILSKEANFSLKKALFYRFKGPKSFPPDNKNQLHIYERVNSFHVFYCPCSVVIQTLRAGVYLQANNILFSSVITGPGGGRDLVE
jgi:hypothetical protein